MKLFENTRFCWPFRVVSQIDTWFSIVKKGMLIFFNLEIHKLSTYISDVVFSQKKTHKTNIFRETTEIWKGSN